MNKHADSAINSEFTMCGVAYDAFDTGDAEEPIVFAKDGETVTCTDCRRVINHAKKFKSYRQPQGATNEQA